MDFQRPSRSRPLRRGTFFRKIIDPFDRGAPTVLCERIRDCDGADSTSAWPQQLVLCPSLPLDSHALHWRRQSAGPFVCISEVSDRSAVR
ncbi:hypothetical protein KC366_g13 [Hortaea werneckii]|nr:hypothetical protein KC366_g13 [Hortaea werneckii]